MQHPHKEENWFKQQKYEIQKSSTTASRISQRLAVSIAQLEYLELELWDMCVLELEQSKLGAR